MRFKGFLLDLDGTLYDYSAAHKAALARSLSVISGRFSIEPGRAEALYLASREQVHRRLSGTAASHNRLLYFQLLLESAGINPLKYSLEITEEYWHEFLENMRLRDGAEEFLDAAGKAGICLLTDLTADIQHRKVLKLDLQDRVGSMVTSEEAGAEKPAPAIFLAGLEKLGIPAAQACMVGDDWEKDILGASRQGITSYWLSAAPRAENGQNPLIRRFGSFRELTGLLT